MPRGGWLLIIALVGLAEVGSAFAQQKNWDVGRQSKAQQSAANPKPSISPPDLSPIERLVERIARQIEAESKSTDAEEESNRAIRDVLAQEAMAHWAKWMTWATVAGVGVGLVSLALLWLTAYYAKRAAGAADAAAEAARDTVTVTRRIGEAQARAYVQVIGIHAEWGTGSHPNVVVTVSNSGPTPARWYSYRAALVPPDRPSLPFNRQIISELPETRWYGLPANTELTFAVSQAIVLPFLEQSGPNKSILRIDGLIEYETFFEERFVSEFSFFGAVTQQIWRTQPHHHAVGGDSPRYMRLSRTTQELRTYVRIG